jgi:hypothetical protein
MLFECGLNAYPQYCGLFHVMDAFDRVNCIPRPYGKSSLLTVFEPCFIALSYRFTVCYSRLISILGVATAVMLSAYATQVNLEKVGPKVTP